MILTNHKEKKRSRINWRKNGSQQKSLEPHGIEVLDESNRAIINMDAQLVTRYRQLHNRLSRENGLPKRYGLTSALRGEGVTSVCLGLGAVMAADLEADICVVELNWWWPLITQLVQSPGHPGLAQVVAGAPFEEALLCTSLDNLYLLPAGDLNDEEPTRLAHSYTLRKKLTELNERFDHLILDIPAVLATGDSLALATLADQIGIVVRARVTPSSVVQRALDDIRHLPITSIVLNGEKTAVPDWLYRLIPED